MKISPVLTLFSAILLLPILVNAQVKFEQRLELELKDGYYGESILEFGELGFVLRARAGKKVDKQAQIKFDKYNTDLELVHSETVLMDKKLYQDEQMLTDTRIHTLYKSKKGDYAIVTVDAADLNVTMVEGVVPKKAWIKDMAIIGSYAFFVADVKKVPYLFSVNWITGQQNLIPINISGYKPKEIKVFRFQVLEETEEVLLYLKTFEKKRNEVFVVRLNIEGEKQDQFQFSKDIEKNIVSISASRPDNESFLFTGTYSSKKTGVSEGIFFSKVSGTRLEFIQYYNFLDLNNFLNYLSEKKMAKLERKKERKESKGKEFTVKYRIADHNVIILEDGYLLLGEAYYPTYRTESYSTMVNGQTVWRTRLVFDGYQYTHAFISKFDFQGKIIWDNTFDMFVGQKPFYPKRFIHIQEQTASSLSMVYATDTRIISKAFNFSGKVLYERESEEIDTEIKGDRTKRSYSNTDYWYGNYFLAFGSQVIKNKTGRTERKRKVYFITKIKYE